MGLRTKSFDVFGGLWGEGGGGGVTKTNIEGGIAKKGEGWNRLQI